MTTDTVVNDEDSQFEASDNSTVSWKAMASAQETSKSPSMTYPERGHEALNQGHLAGLTAPTPPGLQEPVEAGVSLHSYPPFGPCNRSEDQIESVPSLTMSMSTIHCRHASPSSVNSEVVAKESEKELEIAESGRTDMKKAGAIAGSHMDVDAGLSDEDTMLADPSRNKKRPRNPRSSYSLAPAPPSKLKVPIPSRNTQSAKSAKKSNRSGAARKAQRSFLATDRHAFDQPIDIETLPSLFEPVTVQESYVIGEPVSFSSTPVHRLSCGMDMIAYDADGNEWPFKPEFHLTYEIMFSRFVMRLPQHEIHVDRFKQFYARIQAGYIDGVPLFLKYPQLSCIKILSWTIFNQFSTSQLSEIMAKHVLVTGCPFSEGTRFDKKGLRALAPLTAQRAITDFSVLAPTSGDADDTPCNPSVVSGLVQDILDNALKRNKILNGLDFPLWKSRESNTYSVDLAAWDYGQGLQSTEVTAPFPTHHMSWGTAGTQHTLTFLHIDSDGVGTEDGPQCGAKLWGVISPRRSLPLSSIYFFLHQGFCVNEVLNESDYDFEAVVLRPGDRFYMKPGTPHFVYGLEDAICVGSHHYVTTLMQETLQGLIHAFVLHKFLTNTQHPPTRQILRKILIFFQRGTMLGQIPPDDPTFQHLPDLQTIDGVLNVVSVAILCFLGNVLDFRTYKAPNQHESSKRTKEQSFLLEQHDVNAIPFSERLSICYARGVAVQVLKWISKVCIFRNAAGSTVSGLPYAFTAQILGALLSYKKAAEDEGLGGAPHCTYRLLSAQVENVVECILDLTKLWSTRSQEPVTSLAFEGKETYTIEWRVGWEKEKEWKDRETDYLYDGLTPFDYSYFTAQQKRCSDESLKIAALMVDEGGPSKRRRKY
ncbi:LOW QUALITY PROTEIN: hypothetical protein CVT26_009706 [Gymnopilus dilepis]|uniref:JmjC domain-containing protein n=1 Tax=Gymnopilus dilepis TaxID=231916 RepID=A0A409WCN3_9AGAR|nr:LOW QUALITY PROTEIN: hypothetical protein CVT26_009706 [Gymnopilus dilepis]